MIGGEDTDCFLCHIYQNVKNIEKRKKTLAFFKLL